MRLKIKGGFTLVDREDYDLVKDYNWHTNFGYACTGQYVGMVNGKEVHRTIRLHRLVMDAPTGKEVDHINGNKLDNRRSNLRLCTREQNKANTRIISTNTTGYKGVSKHKGKWQASIRIAGRLLYLGRYMTKEEAAKAYNDKAFEVFGSFAWLNPIRERDSTGN